MKRFVSAALFAAVALAASTAYADGTVVVQVRSLGGEPADAVVTLTPVSGGSPQSCRTVRGTCRIESVHGGNYIVTADPVGGGESPVPRRVLLPPDGGTVSVTLL